MPNLKALHNKAARLSQKMDVSFRKLRYQGVELKVNPRIKSLGEVPKNRNGQQGELRGRFFELWEAFIGTQNLSSSGIAGTSIVLGSIWEMSEDDGVWFNVFVQTVPIRQSSRYRVEFARFLSGANLSVTYQVGQGTFTTIEGNPTEDTLPANFTAIANQQQRPTTIDLPGLPVSALYLEGYHIEPKAVPAELPINRRMTATLTNPSGQAIEGVFILLPSLQKPNTLAAGRGEELRGYFLMQGSDRS